MIIQTANFPEEGLELDIDEPSEWGGREFAHGPVKGRVRVDRSGDYFLIRGEVRTTVSVCCVRCLADCLTEVNAEIYAVLVSADQMKAAVHDNLELTAEDMDVVIYGDDEFDTDPIIEDQILLSMPENPLCSEACAGLCPKCGVNRNLEQCECGPEKTGGAFSALAGFRPMKS
jgi:uncharacterized protein